jgi:probable rRNA maturation factor
MTIDLELQIATNVKTLPHPSQFKEWVRVVFSNDLEELKNFTNLELTIRIVDQQEIIDLNTRYRHKNVPTNVLSFPGYIEEEFDYHILGDIVICAAVIEEEAKQQNKELLAHWAHMVIHGILHLLGYDHQNIIDAHKMESLEVNLLNQISFY